MILVAGDSMLDRYREGGVERISPEAPVPILRVERETCRPGGAANVAANIVALGCANCRLLTSIGDDPAGEALRRLIPGVSIVTPSGRRTAEKVRYVARRQQLLRTDWECESADVSALYRPAEYDVVVLSDYGKGSLRRCAEMIAKHPRTLVDPKGDDFSKYAGAYLLKPNEAEFRAVVGAWSDESDFANRCAGLVKELRLGALLVTRGERGMSLLDGGYMRHFFSDARDVYDVSGAGDTVIATLAVFLAAGESIATAAEWANKAAGLVVGKFGTATVTMDELRRAH